MKAARELEGADGDKSCDAIISLSSEEIGRNLKNAKFSYFQKYGQLSQKEICKRIGIHDTQLSHYESGRRVPSLEVFCKLCRIYQVDPAIILGMEIFMGKMSTCLATNATVERPSFNRGLRPVAEI